jgi:ATP-binding cassette subfamily B protein
VSLALPVAVRRVVDHFGEAELALLDRYFGGAIAMAGLLAGERRCATTS